jgi:hypothetical protein
MTLRSRLTLPLLILFILAGPAAAVDDKACPPPGLTIKEETRRFSLLVPKSANLGNEQAYDDIGCAVMSRNEECATRQGMFDSAALAYDYFTGAELPAEKMYFVLQTDVKTPRGFGIVAFKDKAESEKFSAAHGKGKVIKWFELVDEKLK